MLKIRSLIFGGLCAVLLWCAVLSLFALVVLKIGLPSCSAAEMIGLLSGVIAAMGGAFLSARMSQVRGLLHGAALSLLLMLFYIVLGLVLKFTLVWNVVLVRLLAFIVSGALGGMLGVNRTQYIRF